ncbi:toll/interleukin-1 receptor domain-containing protein [Methylomicrobium agile]|uniref:toll/interleukin-1 receptor domain-containing protein n=1 Tax=Methylomicrobium agile TaxID=39774 RepID=UPI0014708161|nr:toll/interleukin-1 receptor domain-containing protein [Methylomicrobium agile]
MTDGTSLNNHVEQFALDWKQQAGINGIIIPVLPPSAGGFSLPKSLQSMNRLADVGNAAWLATDILRWIQVGAERKLFLSYRRDDTKSLADQIHHALVQRGYRVYLDRFSGTPGRFFPQEIAEELADKGCVLLLESPNLAKSRWTRWEIAFARHYHLGLMALNVDGAPPLPAGPQSPDRMNVRTQPSSEELSISDLGTVIDFIARRYTINSIARRVFYEELLRKTSQSEGVGFQELGNGTYALSAHGKTALVYPSGRPGNLSELHNTAVTSSFTSTFDFRILAGQHQHLPPRANQELDWLAHLAIVLLRGPYQLPGSIHDFANGVNP